MHFSIGYRLSTHSGCTFHLLHHKKPRLMLQHPDNPALRWSGQGRKPRWLLAWETEHQSWDGIGLMPVATNLGGNAKTESVAG